MKTGKQLSSDVVRRMLAPHLDSLGKTDRDRIILLLDVMKTDTSAPLSVALNTLYPEIYSVNTDNALSAFRQLRLRFKNFAEGLGIYLLLKADTQTRARPEERWCWFEGDDPFLQELVRFSYCETGAADRIQYPIQQQAVSFRWEEIRSLVFQNKSIGLNQYDVGSEQFAFEHLKYWALESRESCCALLGEYGMGKTTTCMLFTRWLLDQRKNNPSLPLPIYMDLRNLGDKRQIDAMGLVLIIDTLLKNSVYGGQLECSIQAKELIRCVQQENVLAIFDGLDEVLVHVSAPEGQRLTQKLLSILGPDVGDNTSGGRVLITCRTHYFRTEREQNTYFSVRRGGIGVDDYRLIVLQPFSERQISEYLAHVVPDMDSKLLIELIRSVHNLFELAERPYTLSLIPDLVPYIEQKKREKSSVTGAMLYRHMVLSWLERDSGKHQITPDHKLQMMEYFSAELWRSGMSAWTVSNLEQWLVDFLKAHPEIEMHYTFGKEHDRMDHILERLQEDFRTATFLVRSGHADFRFAHQSLLEFFLATYLHRALTEGRVECWDMPVVSQETLNFLCQLLNEGDNSLAIDTLCGIRGTYRTRISELAFAYMLYAHKHHYPSPAMTGFDLSGADLRDWNMIGTPSVADKKSAQLLDISGASFRGARLDNASFRYVNLEQADFSHAHLVNVEIISSQLRKVSFSKADATGAWFVDINFEGTDFSDAKIAQAQWVRCNLTGVKNLYPDEKARFLFAQCEPVEFHAQQLSTVSTSTHQSVVYDCAFSPDGQYLISASIDRTLRLWSVGSGECIYVFQEKEGVRSCAWSPDGNYVASSSHDSSMRIWSMQTRECLHVLTGHDSTALACTFSPDGQYIASASTDNTLRIWDVSTGKCLNVLTGHQERVSGCVFTRDGQRLLSSSWDKTLRIWDVLTGKCLRVLTGRASWNRCTLSSDGQWLAVASTDKTVSIWDIEKGVCTKVLFGHTGRVRDCAFFSEDKKLVSASEDRTLRIWDISSGECLNVLTGHQGSLKACVYSPVISYIASTSDDPTIRLWNANTGDSVKILGQCDEGN